MNGISAPNGTQNAAANANGHAGPSSRRFDVSLSSGEDVEINLDDLRDDQETLDEVSQMLIREGVPLKYWVWVMGEFHQRGNIQTAIAFGERGANAYRNRGQDENAARLLCMMATYAMLESRSAPKTALQTPRQYKVKSQPKTVYFQRATTFVSQAEQLLPRDGFVLDTKGLQDRQVKGQQS